MNAERGVPPPVLRAWLAVAACTTVIFVFSGDEFSAANTSRILEPILRWLFPDIAPATMAAIHMAVRKGAHLTEYGLLGLLAARALRLTLAISTARAALLSLALVLAVSATDEFHQSFLPSRTGVISDVGIDLTGGALGVWLLILAHRAAGVGPPAAVPGRRG
jgi:VanZ family protein